MTAKTSTSGQRAEDVKNEARSNERVPLSQYLQTDEAENDGWAVFRSDESSEEARDRRPNLAVLKQIKSFLNDETSQDESDDDSYEVAQNFRVDYPFYDRDSEASPPRNERKKRGLPKCSRVETNEASNIEESPQSDVAENRSVVPNQTDESTVEPVESNDPWEISPKPIETEEPLEQEFVEKETSNEEPTEAPSQPFVVDFGDVLASAPSPGEEVEPIVATPVVERAETETESQSKEEVEVVVDDLLVVSLAPLNASQSEEEVETAVDANEVVFETGNERATTFRESTTYSNAPLVSGLRTSAASDRMAIFRCGVKLVAQNRPENGASSESNPLGDENLTREYRTIGANLTWRGDAAGETVAVAIAPGFSASDPACSLVSTFVPFGGDPAFVPFAF